MPRRPDTLETVLLALELLRRIPRNRKVSARELHAQIAETEHVRDLRTIQRQLEMLSNHFEIERDDSNKPYGYRWKEQARGFSMPSLSPQESLVLTLAEKHLAKLLPASHVKAMAGLFQQARSNLYGVEPNARLEREWLDKVMIVDTTQPLIPPKIRPGVLDEISTALYSNRWLEVDYRNASGKQSCFEVMPLGLAQQGPRLYLVCRFKGFDNERSLAVHRISSAKATHFTFHRPLGFDLKQYDEDGRFGVGDGERVQLKFSIIKDAGQHLLESPLTDDQHVVERESHYEITVTVVNTLQLQRWLRGFGSDLLACEFTPVTSSK